MVNLSTQFSSYFKQLPQAESIRIETDVRGWLEEQRISVFSNPNSFQVKKSFVSSDIGAELYFLSYWTLSVVIAFYQDDNNVLWLDNHNNNTDFSIFSRRESLYSWLPEHLDDFVSLLIKTKLNFLGEPRLVGDVSDVPRIAEDYRNYLLTSQEGITELTRRETLINEVAGKVHTPISSNKNGSFFIEFFVWTRILGNLIRISCFIKSDGIFDYNGNVIAESIGNFYVPR